MQKENIWVGNTPLRIILQEKTKLRQLDIKVSVLLKIVI